MRSSSVLLRSDPRNPRMRFPAWRWEETCGKRIDVPLSFHESFLLSCSPWGFEMPWGRNDSTYLAHEELWKLSSQGHRDYRVYLWPLLSKPCSCQETQLSLLRWSLLPWSPIALLGSSALFGNRFPISTLQYLEERWITYWWLQGNLMCPTKCREKLKYFFLNQPIWKTSKR